MTLTQIKLLVVGLLLVYAGLATFAAIHEHDTLVKFRDQVAEAGKQAEKDAQATEAKHQQLVKEFSDAWLNQLPQIRNAAVSAYLARYPQRVLDTCGSQVSQPSGDPQGPDGASGQRVDAPTCRPDEQFIKDCATDAGKVRQCREWAKAVGFPVGN